MKIDGDEMTICSGRSDAETKGPMSVETTPLVGSGQQPKYLSVNRQLNGSNEKAHVGDSAKQDNRGSENSGFTRTQRKLLASLTVVSVLNGSLIAVMIPFFPVEAASRGVSQTVISGVFSCFAVVQIAVSPVVGRVAPVVGVTRLYNIGLATAGLTTVVFGTLDLIKDTRTFVAACFLVRAVEATGTAAVSTCAFTIAGSQFPRRVSTVVAVLGSSMTVGLALTPAVWGGLYALGGFGAPFYTLGLVMLLMVAVNVRLMPAVEQSARRGAASFCTSLRLLAGSAGNWVCLATVFMSSSDFTTVDSTIAPYVHRALGLTPAQISLYFLVSTGLYAVANVFWAWLAERIRNRYIMMSICLLLSSVGIMLIAPSPMLNLSPSWWIIAVGMSIEEVFFGGAFTPCLELMVVESVARGLEDNLATRSFVSSVFTTAFSMGVAIGPVSGGMIVDSYGFPTMTTVLALLTALVGCLVTVKAVCAHRSEDDLSNVTQLN